MKLTAIILTQKQNSIKYFNINVVQDKDTVTIKRYIKSSGELISVQELNINKIKDNLNSENALLMLSFDNEGRELPIYNRDKHTFNNEDDIAIHRAIYNYSNYGMFFKKFKDQPVNQLVLNIGSKDSLSTNIKDITYLENDNQPFNKLIVKLSSNSNTILKDKNQLVDVQLFNREDMTKVLKEGIEVYLTTDKGFISHNKLITNASGSASLKVGANMLEDNEVLTIQAGFKYNAAIDTIKLKVKNEI